MTGANGFIGSWLYRELVNRGHKVTSTDTSGCDVNIDLRDTEDVHRLIGTVKPDVIFHLAAYAAEGQSVFSPIAINDINIKSMNNLLVAAVNNNVKRFVFTSSMAVYGDSPAPFDETTPRKPVDPYGLGKAYCEQMLEIFYKLHGLEYCIIRPHNVYGPKQNIADPYRNVMGIWMNRVLGGKAPVVFGDGRQERAFSYIEDVIPPLANAGFFDAAKNQIINLGSSEIISINDAFNIFHSICKADGLFINPQHEPERKGEVKVAYCTTKKSEELLGFEENHCLSDGLFKMWKWAKEHGPQEPTYTLPLEIERGAPEIWSQKKM